MGPAVIDAQQAVKSIKKQHLVEVRSMSRITGYMPTWGPIIFEGPLPEDAYLLTLVGDINF